MVCHRPAEEIVDGRLKESDPTTERLGRQWRMSRERPMDDEWCALERRRAKEHRLPEIVHPRQMGRPVHMSDIVEDGPEEVIISNPVVEHVHEARDITTISNIEPMVLHIRLLSAPRHHRSDELTTSLRLSKNRMDTLVIAQAQRQSPEL